jgi:hypothetical protein
LERTSDQPLRIAFSLRDVFDGDEAKAIIRPVLESILKHLAFELHATVGEPTLSSLSLPQDESASSILAELRFPLRRVVTQQDMTLDHNQRQNLSSASQHLLGPADVYSAYRFALDQADAVTRFMLLYNILLRLHNDKQPDVDTFIKQEEPQVAKTPSPRSPNKLETKYMKLRNEVAHARLGRSPSETREDIVSNVSKLQQLVRRDISLQP